MCQTVFNDKSSGLYNIPIDAVCFCCLSVFLDLEIWVLPLFRSIPHSMIYTFLSNGKQYLKNRILEYFFIIWIIIPEILMDWTKQTQRKAILPTQQLGV